MLPAKDDRPGVGEAASTRFLVLRDGTAYFEGDPQALLETSDPYLKSFLE